MLAESDDEDDFDDADDFDHLSGAARQSAGAGRVALPGATTAAMSFVIRQYNLGDTDSGQQQLQRQQFQFKPLVRRVGEYGQPIRLSDFGLTTVYDPTNPEFTMRERMDHYALHGDEDGDVEDYDTDDEEVVSLLDEETRKKRGKWPPTRVVDEVVRDAPVTCRLVFVDIMGHAANLAHHKLAEIAAPQRLVILNAGQNETEAFANVCRVRGFCKAEEVYVTCFFLVFVFCIPHRPCVKVRWCSCVIPLQVGLTCSSFCVLLTVFRYTPAAGITIKFSKARSFKVALAKELLATMPPLTPIEAEHSSGGDSAGNVEVAPVSGVLRLRNGRFVFEPAASQGLKGGTNGDTIDMEGEANHDDNDDEMYVDAVAVGDTAGTQTQQQADATNSVAGNAESGSEPNHAIDGSEGGGATKTKYKAQHGANDDGNDDAPPAFKRKRSLYLRDRGMPLNLQRISELLHRKLPNLRTRKVAGYVDCGYGLHVRCQNGAVTLSGPLSEQYFEVQDAVYGMHHLV